MINLKKQNLKTLLFLTSVILIPLKKWGSIAILSTLSGYTYANQSFDAETQRLQTKAGKSYDLYVESSFNFRTFKTITLDILVTNTQGLPSANKILLVSTIPDGEDDQLEQRYVQKSVLSLIRTDEYGRVYKPIEVSNSISSLLIELNEQTANNKVLIDVPDSLHVSHSFEIQ